MKTTVLTALAIAVMLVSCSGNASSEDNKSGKQDPVDPTPAFKEEADDPAADPQGSWDYSKIASHSHPRLLMDSVEFAAVQNAAKTDPVVKKFNDMLLQNAAAIVDSPQAALTYQIVDGYLIYVSWNAVARIVFASYAYRATGEEKYLKFVEKDLQAISLFKDWYPSHYLGTAELALAAAIGYDWCYKGLSLNTRKMVRRAINLLAFDTCDDANVWKKTNNWNQVCLGSLTLAALATYEKNKAASAKILDAVVPSNSTSLQLSYSPNGNYAEGYNYWGYATIFQSLMMTVFDDFFGTDNGLSNVPGWNDTCDYLLFMVGMNGLSFNYSDCGEGCSPKAPMWYFAWKQNRPELLATEMRLLDAGLYPACAEWRFLPLAMKWIAGVNTSNLKYPEEHLWTGEGEAPIAIVHTDWTWSETDKYLGVKAGMANAHHGHMDAGSFVYDAFGQRWACDIGPEDYARFEELTSPYGQKFFFYEKNALRWNCFRLNNKSHNTLTINDAIHDPNGAAVIKTVKKDAPYEINLDMTKPLADGATAATRKFTLDGDVLSIEDEVTTKGAATLNWHIVTRAIPTVEGDCIKLEQGGKTLYIQTGGTAGLTPIYKAYPAPTVAPVVGGDGKNSGGWDITSNNGYYVAAWEVQVPVKMTVKFTTTLKQ